MSEIQEFRDLVEGFLVRENMTPSRFGRIFANDANFWFQVRRGREPRTLKRQEILRHMADYMMEPTLG